MVYKIIGQFSDDKFASQLEKLKEFFIFIYKDETLYIALKNISDIDRAEEIIKKIFKPQKNYLFIQINQENILKEDQLIGEWCLNSFVRLETQLYERNKQSKLKQVWADMDKMEEKLQSILEAQQKENTNIKRKEE